MPNPIGTITMWGGLVAGIPVGWQLCDGTNGTPDLRNKFIRGAGAAFIPGDEGGSSQHSHSFDAGSHQHESIDTLDAVAAAGTSFWSAVGAAEFTDFESVSGTTGLQDTIPPFFALAFIQRLT